MIKSSNPFQSWCVASVVLLALTWLEMRSKAEGLKLNSTCSNTVCHLCNTGLAKQHCSKGAIQNLTVLFQIQILAVASLLQSSLNCCYFKGRHWEKGVGWSQSSLNIFNLVCQYFLNSVIVQLFRCYFIHSN